MSRRKAVPRRIHAGGEAYMLRLRTDHAGLSRLLREIDTQQSLLRADPKAARPLLVEALRYLLQYQHAFHHQREDLLFARIQKRTPRLTREIQRLGRQHRIAHRRAERLAAGLGYATMGQLSGRQGAKLAQDLQDYVRHTRNHMRREEALFYARSERVLKDADWQALATGESMSDPMTDLRRLAAEYPLLAASLARPVREIGGADDADRSSQPVHALRHGLEQLVEIYGELLHDALELAWSNFDSLRGIRSPSGLMRVVRPVYSRNRRFAGRCVTQPARWIRETAGAVFAASWVRGST